MSEARGRVDGLHAEHEVRFYGLSTCVWCKKTRRYLEEAGVAFDFTYLDLLKGDERAEALAVVKKWNPAATFPTIVIDGEKSVTGFSPDEMAQLLGL
jgi:glutaredoxin-like protein NrdH